VHTSPLAQAVGDLEEDKAVVLVQDKLAKGELEHQAFVDAVKESGATLVGMSCLLTTVFDEMKIAVQTIKDAGLRDQVTVLIGGGPVDQATADYVGADVYCKTAQDDVMAARKVLGVS
jgi:dimethylamine corrinoid protein